MCSGWGALDDCTHPLILYDPRNFFVLRMQTRLRPMSFIAIGRDPANLLLTVTEPYLFGTSTNIQFLPLTIFLRRQD